MMTLKQAETQVPCVISPEDAHDLYRSGSIVFADVRWYPDSRDPRQSYITSHLPGARFVDVERDLSSAGQHSETAGRHPFPDPEEFAAAMARLGITNDARVVAYDDTGGMTAARLVVMLRMLGVKASLLDGGIGVWSALHPHLVESGEPTPAPRAEFSPRPWPDDRLVAENEMSDIVATGADARGVLVLDARSRERFEGSAPSGAGTLDPRAGHIPGAVNSPWTAVLDPASGRLRPAADLRSYFDDLGVDDAGDVITSCGSGISACLNLLAIEYSGHPPPRLFVASWSGWAADPAKPTETGPSSFGRDRLHQALVRRSSDAVSDLRAARRHRRLADLEWFEALYRVYLAAFVFGGGTMFISGFVPDEPVSERTALDVWSSGPGWLGLAAVVAIGIGLRSGSRGGPLAVEEPDVHYVLLAPISRRRVLLRPITQMVRTAMFAMVLLGALAGYLAARRLPGTAPEWMMWGGLWGATTGLLYAGSALVAHGLRVPRWVSTLFAVVLVSWQFLTALPESSGIAVTGDGPGDLLGRLALGARGIEVSALVFPIIGLGFLGIGTILAGRQSIEALVRRSALVSQLRFAVTIQDLRTVTLLRRRLSEEKSRTRPWMSLRGTHRFGAEWKRTWSGILRFPISRVIRLVLLCVVAGLACVAAYHGTTPAIVAVGLALFAVGLEILEPLAQEIDQSDRTSSYPHPRGLIHLRLLSPIAILAPALASIMIATIAIAERDMWLVGIIGSISALFAACAGAAVNIISGSPDPLNSTVSQNTMPPEVAGTMSIVKSLWPVALATAGGLPFVFASVARTDGMDPQAAAARCAVAIVLGVGLVAVWIRRRDDIRLSLDNAIRESRGSLPKGRT